MSNWPRRYPTQPTPDSPCVRNCCLDEHDVCLGCGRELQEILRWQSASTPEREAILEAAQARLRQRRRTTPSNQDPPLAD